MFKVGDTVRVVYSSAMLPTTYEGVITEINQGTIEVKLDHGGFLYLSEKDMIANGSVIMSTNSESSLPKACIHEFITYVGLTDTYDYCKKCDYKEK